MKGFKLGRAKRLAAAAVAVVMVLAVQVAASAEIRFGETVSVSRNFTHILSEDGTLWAMGDNQYGQLGDGTNVQRLAPVKVFENVVHVASGDNHVLAITADGELWAWGDHSRGQLGVGAAKDPNLLPMYVMDEVYFAGAHGNISFAIKNDGTLWYWGANSFAGLLGPISFVSNANVSINTPMQIMTNAEYAATNGAVMAVIARDGVLWMWGSNENGLLGDGSATTQRQELPAPLARLSQAIPAASEGGEGEGEGEEPGGEEGGGEEPGGEEGEGEEPEGEPAEPAPTGGEEAGGTPSPSPSPSASPSPAPTPIIIEAVNRDRMLNEAFRPLQNVRDIVFGAKHVLALTNNNELYAWGSNDQGQLGMMNVTAVYTPALVANRIKSVAAGDNHNLAVGLNNELYIWGSGSHGQLGEPQYFKGSNPVVLQSKILDGIENVWAAANQSAVVRTDGSLYMWGQNNSGSVGDGNPDDKTTPLRIIASGAGYLWITGQRTFMVTDEGGALWGWGSNEYGNLGRGDKNPSLLPHKIWDEIALPGTLVAFDSEEEEEEEEVPAVDGYGIEIGDVNNPAFYAIDYSLLDGVKDDITALAAVKEVVLAMSVEQKQNKDNVDAVVRFAEHAVMKALEVTVNSASITLNRDFAAQYERAVKNLAELTLSYISDNSIVPDRRVDNALRVVLPEGAASINVDQNFKNTAIDRFVVAAGEIEIIIDAKQVQDSFTVSVGENARKTASENAAAAKTGAHGGIRVDITGNMANGSKVIVAIPAIRGLADKIQTVFNGNMENIGGKVNPNTHKMETFIKSTATLTVSEANLRFNDIGSLNANQQNAIAYLKSKGRVAGRNDTTFDPLAPINRSEFGAMLLFALSESDPNATTDAFFDVVPGDWFLSIAAVCKENGYISGSAMDDGTLAFLPRVAIPREQLLAIAGRVLQQKKNYMPVDGASYLGRYTDFMDIPTWFHNDIALMAQAKLFEDFPGGAFIPYYEMNRGEAAVIISNLYKRLY